MNCSWWNLHCLWYSDTFNLKYSANNQAYNYYFFYKYQCDDNSKKKLKTLKLCFPYYDVQLFSPLALLFLSSRFSFCFYFNSCLRLKHYTLTSFIALKELKAALKVLQCDMKNSFLFSTDFSFWRKSYNVEEKIDILQTVFYSQLYHELFYKKNRILWCTYHERKFDGFFQNLPS